jgi:Tfp pilus assembly PilM family ATPase
MIKKIITIVEITDAHIKLLQARKARGKPVIKFCDIRLIERCPDEEVEKVWKEMVAALPAVPVELIIIVPRRLVILRQMRLPSRHDEEIRDMVGLQLVNNLPFPVEDVVYQHHILEQGDDGYSRILVTVMNREVSRRYGRLTRAAGVKDGQLTFSSLGILEWSAPREQGKKPASQQSVMVVHVDAKHCEICFCHHQKLFFSRSVPWERENWTPEAASNLVDQLKRSLVSYHQEHLGPPVEKTSILSADQGVGALLKDLLERELEMPAEVVDPWSRTARSLKESPGKPLGDICSMIPALGFLSSNAKNLINLMPGEIQVAEQVRTRRLRTAKFVVLFLAATVFSMSGPFVDVYKKEKFLSQLKTQRELTRPQLTEALKKIRFIQFFDQKFQDGIFIPDLVRELAQVTPDNISFRAVSLDKQGQLIVEGSAQTHADINDFQTGMIQSSYFQDVDLMFATKRRVANMEMVDFKIASRLGDHTGGGL